VRKNIKITSNRKEMIMESRNSSSFIRQAATIVVGVFGMVGSLGAMAGTIVGSAHDLSARGWSGGQICVVCHTPHFANVSVADAPLWNHAITTKTYQLYASGTLNAVTGQPTGVSKLCLSCHDGTVALDSFGGTTGVDTIGAQFAVGAGPNDLRDDHPISITYDTALATADGALFDPATRAATIGSGTQTKTGTIATTMLYGGQVQCASCHDVHNAFTAGAAPNRLLKVTKAGSALCLTCHNK
jgi:predicted CXXCH cytochrome family protein